jgi:hypothetical protein
VAGAGAVAAYALTRPSEAERLMQTARRQVIEAPYVTVRSGRRTTAFAGKNETISVDRRLITWTSPHLERRWDPQRRCYTDTTRPLYADVQSQRRLVLPDVEPNRLTRQAATVVLHYRDEPAEGLSSEGEIQLDPGGRPALVRARRASTLGVPAGTWSSRRLAFPRRLDVARPPGPACPAD